MFRTMFIHTAVAISLFEIQIMIRPVICLEVWH